MLKALMKLAELTIIGFLALAPALLFAQQPPQAETPKGPGFVIRQDLPPMDGSKLRLSVLELECPPGGSTDKHFHNGPEAPKGVHSISKNASQTEKARALVVFLNEGTAPLTVPLKKTEKQ